MVGHGLTDAGHEVVGVPGGYARDGGWWYEDVPIEISEHPFGAGLRAGVGDDAEVLGANLVAALGWMGPEGFADEMGRRRRPAARRDVMAMRTPPGLEREKSQTAG